MARAKRGSIRWFSSGNVETFKGKKVARSLRFRGHQYKLVGATGSKVEAARSASGYRRQFGRALVRRLEPGNFGIYAGGTFGK